MPPAPPITIYVGIDPGKKGAAAAIDADGRFLGMRDPALAPGRQHYDDKGMLALGRWIAGLGPSYVCLEDVWGQAGDGGASAFTFGQGLQAWRMALAAANLTPELIAPQKWKAHLGLPGKKADPKAKRLAVEMARREYPAAAPLLRRVSVDDGRAEALLIAHFKRLTTIQGVKGWTKGDQDRLMAAALMGGRRPRRRPSLPGSL